MSKQQEAMRLALEALKCGDTLFYPETKVAIAALIEALAEQERFAALVAAAEREAIIKATIDQGFVGQAYADDFAAVIRNRGKK